MILSSRRQLLQGTASAAACLTTPGLLAAGFTSVAGAEEWFDISLAQWSLHRALRGGGLDNLDFARVAREDYGVNGLEYVNSFFKAQAGNFEYLAKMKKAAGDHGVKSLLIMVDGEGALADEDKTRRRKAVDNHFKWLAAAAYLGCHSIRVNAAGGGDRGEAERRAADSLVHLAEVATPYGLNVIVENHGGLSSDGSWLSAVMRRANHPRVGTLPDFGNFRLGGGKSYDRYKGVEELMPFAKAVSAKSHDFDEHGNEVHTDYLRMMGIVKDAGYRGFVGIEFEGGGLSEKEGILATRRLLERVRSKLQG
ncbi:MAG TPA: sugar phosphate isomerase/epimerase [Planctomycetes bacterium]|nr:sugar phosphate isomerase/epimerase [Planctomycetota bacterium]HIL36493.1 sugar phosphate isomerase/epimerase [Planctomycetota bacterium]